MCDSDKTLTFVQLENYLDDEGGRYYALDDLEKVQDLESLTHIISTNINFPDYARAINLGIDVVKPSWIHLTVRRQRPVNVRQHSPDPSLYFQDVVLTCANLPRGDQDAIIAGVVALGGMYSGPLTKQCTHVVSTDMDNEKCRIVEERGLRCKIVLPHWFDMCLKLGKKINERPYTLPGAEILENNDDAKPPKPSPSPHLEDATTDRPNELPVGSPPPSPSNSRKNLNAFMSRKVFFCRDLELSKRHLTTLQQLINHGGGTLTGNIQQADVYIGRYRDGVDYIRAARAGKEVASLSWLYHVINQNHWTSPTNRLLHYPVPRNGLPGFQNMKISVSNYSGDSRIYLENLIKYCGAEFTKTMKQDNTHLITAHTRSEKVDAAKEWNINIVNHLWIEESYAKGMVMALSHPRYSTFPARTNLGEVCGQMSLDMKRVEQKFYPRSPPTSPQKSPQKPITQPSPRKSVPASSIVGGRTSLPSCDNILQDVPAPQIAEDEETENEEEHEEPQTAKKPQSRRSRSALEATPRHMSEEKENQTPVLSTGRASKMKAIGALHLAGEDMVRYSKEMKRKGGVTHNRRASHPEEYSSPAPAAPPVRKGKKRTSDENTYEVTAMGSDLSDGETQKAGKPAKKAKTGRASGGNAPSLPPIEHRMMVTGDDRWLGNTKKEDADKGKLRQLGIQLTQDPKDVTILVAPKILRTPKFVCALANAPLVVDSKYLDTALKQNKLPSQPSLLSDRDGEERMGFRIADALSRAEVNKHKLFRGWNIYITKDIPGTFDTFKNIVTLNGGDAFMYQGRTALKKRSKEQDDAKAGDEREHQGDEDEYGYVYLVSGTSGPEQKTWETFREAALQEGVEPRIVKADWLLNAAMSQRIAWKDMWELSKGAS